MHKTPALTRKDSKQLERIPCSVSLLTYNSAEGLPRCLDSLKEFAELIICDGNSVDETVHIAKKYGARVISQYDTDEPVTPCAMDKAAVRQRAMDASTLPWRFFMDSDDALSKEAVEEIRAIVTLKEPKAHIYRMPTRIFMDGKEVLHEATYPSYQTRLMHESTGARFKGHVHDRLSWNEEAYPAGTMKSFYDFHWPLSRIRNYWGYLGAYARREVKVIEPPHVAFIMWWSYRRIKTIFGYLFWRLPAMYLRYGFKDSMPLSIELTIVRYHFAVLFGTIGKYIATRLPITLFVEMLRGKDINRILGNIALRPYEAYGRVLDVGGGIRPSYWRYLSTRRWHRRIALDLAIAKPTIVADLETERIPLADAHVDTVLMCNVLEHLHERAHALSEVRRVLAKNGTLIGIVPFLVGVHPDPHDYVRFTDEGLEKLLFVAGFSDIIIFPVGRGPFLASYYQIEFLLPRLLKLLVLPCIFALDAIVLAFKPSWRKKFPLSYVFSAR